MKLSDCNNIIEEQLIERGLALEEETGANVLFLCGPILYGVDDYVREVIEANKKENKKDKLFLMLETNGGYIEVVERIAQTLRYHYSLVDFIIPSHAYSAGTVLAMSGDNIYMDYFSRLGPIDPQLPKDDKMVPALGYLIQYERLIKKSIQGNLSTAELAYLVEKFDPAELYMYEQARQLSITLLKNWLVEYKFKNWKVTETRKKKVTPPMKKRRANEIAKILNKTEYWHTHGRGISIDILRRKLKLKIIDFSKNQDLNNKIKAYYNLLCDYMARRGQRAIIHTSYAYKNIPL